MHLHDNHNFSANKLHRLGTHLPLLRQNTQKRNTILSTVQIIKNINRNRLLTLASNRSS